VKDCLCYALYGIKRQCICNTPTVVDVAVDNDMFFDTVVHVLLLFC